MSLRLMSKKSYVGLDLGHHSIKGCVIKRSQVGWIVTNAVTVPTPPGSIREGIVTGKSEVATAIRGLLKQLGTKANACHISVGGSSVVVRTVQIPKMNENTLRKSIKFEAGRYVPNSPEESYIEFDILNETEDGQMNTMIVAVPREIVDSRREACEMAGLDVVSVDIEPFAAYRSLIESNHGVDADNDTFAIIDLGASSTKVSVISGGSFAMARAIPQGSSILTEALQRYFKLTPDDAEEGKAQLDVRNLLDDGKPTENPPLRVMQPHLDDLIREIRRSLNYYQSQQTESGAPGVVNWMLITGGGANLQGIADYLSIKLGLKVYTASIFDNPRIAFVGDDLGQRGAEMAVASGLAMRSYAKSA